MARDAGSSTHVGTFGDLAHVAAEVDGSDDHDCLHMMEFGLSFRCDLHFTLRVSKATKPLGGRFDLGFERRAMRSREHG